MAWPRAHTGSDSRSLPAGAAPARAVAGGAVGPGGGRPPGLLDHPGPQPDGGPGQGGLQLPLGLGHPERRHLPLAARRLLQRDRPGGPAPVGLARRRRPPLRPPEVRDPGLAGHRRVHRLEPRRAGPPILACAGGRPAAARHRLCRLRCRAGHHRHQRLRQRLRAEGGPPPGQPAAGGRRPPHTVGHVRLGGGPALLRGSRARPGLGRRGGRAPRERHGRQGRLERVPRERAVPGRRGRDRSHAGPAARDQRRGGA